MDEAKESSVLKITLGFIWRLVTWTVFLSILLDVIMSALLTAVTIKNVSSIFNIEGQIRYYRIRGILLIIFDLILCFLSCKYTTDEIIKKYNITINKALIIRYITLTIIAIASFMTFLQIHRSQDAIKELTQLQEKIKNVTTYFADESEVSDFTKVSAFIDYMKGLMIVSILTHIGTYIAIIGFERMWLERA